MDRNDFQNRVAQAYSLIFEQKLAGLEIKKQIEEHKNQGLRIDLQTVEIQNQGKQVKQGIERVKVEILDDDYSTIQSERGLRAERNAIELDGLSQEVSLLRETVQIRLQALREKNIKSLLGD